MNKYKECFNEYYNRNIKDANDSYKFYLLGKLREAIFISEISGDRHFCQLCLSSKCSTCKLLKDDCGCGLSNYYFHNLIVSTMNKFNCDRLDAFKIIFDELYTEIVLIKDYNKLDI